MKYRIAIQKIKQKQFTHIHNIMLESDNEKELIKKIRLVLSDEIEKREVLLLENLYENRKSMINTIIDETDSDLIDFNVRGYDVTKEEFLENEIFHED